MRGFDGAGWRAPVSFASHGARFRVRTNDERVLEAIAGRLPPGARRVPSVAAGPTFSVWVAPANWPRPHALYRDLRRLSTGPTLDDVLARLASELHFVVATGARPHLFVHAGAVAYGGRGVLLPGRSMSGKSELTAALVAAGATYYSDEYAVLDAQGVLHPYRKPISLRRSAEERATADVGAGSPAPRVSAISVGMVVITRYVPGASWRPSRLTRSETMAALLQHTVLARVRPHAAMTTLARAVAAVTGVSGERGEADVTAAALLAFAVAEFGEEPTVL